MDDTIAILDTPSFERFGVAGFMDVQSVADALNDLLPPSRISDLSLIHIGNDTLILEWTAVGDNFDHGTGMFYYIRALSELQVRCLT